MRIAMQVKVALRFWFFLGALAALPSQALSSGLMSCYDQEPLDKQLATFKKEPQRELIVVLDRTVDYGENNGEKFKNDVFDTLNKALKAGDRLVLISFGNLDAKGYPETAFDANLDYALTGDSRKRIGRRTLRTADLCIAKYNGDTLRAFAQAFQAEWERIDPNFKSTPLLNSLKYTSAQVNIHDGQSFILLVSDLMQHRDDRLTFYGSSFTDTETAIKKPEVASLVKDVNFHGAKIYNLGIGFNATGGLKKLGQLENFWSRFFEETNAEVVEFATVSLTRIPGE